jgi:hypothetical protein
LKTEAIQSKANLEANLATFMRQIHVHEEKIRMHGHRQAQVGDKGHFY